MRPVFFFQNMEFIKYKEMMIMMMIIMVMVVVVVMVITNSDSKISTSSVFGNL
jgi:hypothetical protein